MRVPYGYLTEQFRDPEKIFARIRKTVEVGLFTLGPELEEFEKRFAELHAAKYALGVSSGTDALILSLKALGIGGGDEVITAPNSFIATAGAVAMAGARPVFADVTEAYTISPPRIEAAITPKTKAIIPVHLTGSPAPMEMILGIAKKHNLHVIEDAAQAVTAKYGGKPVGSWGIAGAFSLHPLKNLNIWGDGGVVTTSDDALYERLKLWRNHGLRNRDECDFFAYNNRLDTLQAAVANCLLDDIAEITRARRRHAALYDARLARLAPQVRVPPRDPRAEPVFHTYVIQVEQREKLMEHLKKENIEAKIHYPIPIHLQNAARHLGYKRGDFPVAEAQAERIISLPIHQYLAERDLEYVCDSIETFYRKG